MKDKQKEKKSLFAYFFLIKLNQQVYYYRIVSCFMKK